MSVGSGGDVRYRMAEMFSRVHASRENDHIVCALHPVSVIHYIFIQLFLKNNFRNLIRESRLLQVSRAWYPSSSIPFADGSWDPRGREGLARLPTASQAPPPRRPLAAGRQPCKPGTMVRHHSGGCVMSYETADLVLGRHKPSGSHARKTQALRVSHGRSFLWLVVEGEVKGCRV